MVDVKNLVFAYQSQDPIIYQLSFTSQRGKILSIVGNSGIGKTTLLKLLIGVLAPQAGSIEVPGNYSYLSQTPTLLDYRNALENALLGCELRGQLNADKIQQASSLFEQFRLYKTTQNKFVNELSGGMKQRIGIIQTLLVEADVYVMDEPFNAVDRNTNLVIQDYIWDRSRKNETSLLLVTHDLEHSLRLCDEILLLIKHDTFVKLQFSEEYIAVAPSKRAQTSQYGSYLLQIVNILNQV